MKSVLSIQSHTVFGQAGNKAAILPMQLLGIDAWALNTVQFSNHTQYGKWTGMVIPPAQIGEIAKGIDDIGQLGHCDAVLSGYIGAADQGDEILKLVAIVKERNPNALYFCDPVMGHPDKGCIVAEGVSDFLKEKAVYNCDIIAPNLVELRELSGRKVENFAEAVDAARIIKAKGAQRVLVKHLSYAGRNPQMFEMLLLNDEGVYHIERPLHQFKEKDPVGVGDLTSAIFLSHLLNGKSDGEAFELCANAVNDVMHITAQSGLYELQIITARHEIISPKSSFKAVKIA